MDKNFFTIPELVERAATNYKDRPALRLKSPKKEDIEEIGFLQLRQEMYETAVDIVQKMGTEEKRIALIGELDHRWIKWFYGILASGNVVIPMDKGLSVQELEKQLSEVAPECIILGNLSKKKEKVIKEKYEEIILENIGNCKRDYIISDLPQIEPERKAIMIFTSGTTGKNKIVVLTHKNIISNLKCCIYFLEDAFSPGQNITPVLPPTHMFQITTGIIAPLYYGVAVCFGGGIRYLLDSMKTYKPTILILVPLVVKNLYERIENEIRRQGKEKKFQCALKISKALRKVGIDVRKKFFEEVRKPFGGNLEIIVCGGSHLDPELVDKYGEIGVDLRNGYGITECSPVISCNRKKEKKPGTAGIVIPSEYGEVALIDEEVCVRGDIVFSEYYNNPLETKKAFHKDWFRTGDLGRIDEEGFLTITGRLKNLIVLDDGNNISPEELEGRLENNEKIRSVFVREEKYDTGKLITAHIFPEYETFQECTKSEVQEAIRKDIRIANRDLPRYKRIQKVRFADKDFEKTALGKIKRFKHKGVRCEEGVYDF